MNELFNTKSEELYQICIQPLKDVERILNDFFGEDKIDMQNICSLKTFQKYLQNKTGSDTEDFYTPLSSERLISLRNQPFFETTILIYFPTIRVTDDYGNYVDIKKVYVSIKINGHGRLLGTFLINRAEYDQIQASARYVHSHVSSNSFSQHKFRESCLGRGPIKSTMLSLTNNFDEDLWRLFCLELYTYLQTESTSGGPYIELNKIHVNSSHSKTYLSFACTETFSLRGIPRQDFIEFYIYILKSNKLKYAYVDNSYTLAFSFQNAVVLLSNLFIEWYNKSTISQVSPENIQQVLWENKILLPATLTGLSIQYEYSNSSALPAIGKQTEEICTFKGEKQFLEITPSITEVLENKLWLLEPTFCSFIIFNILYLINYSYGRPNLENPSTSDKETLYL